MTTTDATVFLVEDNLEMRESLQWMLESDGFRVQVFAGPAELLACYQPERPGCLVLDLRLPEMTGLELQRVLSDRGGHHPFIMITGHGDVPNAVEAMREGAVDFIQKPFSRPAFLQRVAEAIDRDRRDREQRARDTEVEQRIASLTPRERQVMQLVIVGKLTKQIARQLGISQKTVEVHRSNITKKMQVESVAQLVNLVSRLPLAETAVHWQD